MIEYDDARMILCVRIVPLKAGKTQRVTFAQHPVNHGIALCHRGSLSLEGEVRVEP